MPSSTKIRIILYVGGLVALLGFGSPSGGLLDIPISFFLKNKLHLDAHELAVFKMIAGIPLYLSFLFGLFRDSDPMALGDRGLMIVFGLLTCIVYIFFAFAQVSYVTLLAACLLLTSTFLFVAAGQNGLTASLGQRHEMSGQISAAWNVFLTISTVLTLLIGGVLSNKLERTELIKIAHQVFFAGAAVMAAVACYGVWKPDFISTEERRATQGSNHSLSGLLRNRAIYPALLMWLLWNFAPGSATALQYYLQDSLKADDAQWGQWNAIFTASFAPTFLIFGILCRWFTMKTLLICGTAIAIPQMVPLLFIHSVGEALLAAIPIGLMGGFATAAYLDLIIRSSPQGFEGTILMMSASLYFISSRFGDLIGAEIYGRYQNFTLCVIAITLTYFLILPLIFLIPKDILVARDQ